MMAMLKILKIQRKKFKQPLNAGCRKKVHMRNDFIISLFSRQTLLL